MCGYNARADNSTYAMCIGGVMEEADKAGKVRQAAAQTLYPWLADPCVDRVWLSRAVYALCVAVAAVEHKDCLMVSELIGIQLFFSMIGMSRGQRYGVPSRALRTVAYVVFGIAFSAIITLALFCFEGVAILAGGTAQQHELVLYLSPVIFAVLVANWLLAGKFGPA